MIKDQLWDLVQRSHRKVTAVDLLKLKNNKVNTRKKKVR